MATTRSRVNNRRVSRGLGVYVAIFFVFSLSVSALKSVIPRKHPIGILPPLGTVQRSNKILGELRGGGSANISNHDQHGLSETKRRRLTVLLVAMALFNDTLQLTMLLPIIPTLVSSPPPLGLEANAEIAMGVFFASKDICQLAFAPLAGYLTARTSSNVALTVSTVALGLATLVFASCTTFRQLLLARSMQGAASAAVLCGGLSLIAETHSVEARGSAMAMAYSGLALGVLCGPLIGGWLFHKLGRHKTFSLAGILVLANAAAQVALMVLAPPAKMLQDSKNKKEAITTVFGSFRTMFANREVLAVAGAIFAVHAVVGVVKPLSQVVLEREFGMAIVQRSLVITVATAAYLIGTPIAGYMSDRMSRPRLVGISLMLAGLSTLAFALRGIFGIAMFSLCMGCLGLSLAWNGSVAQALLADLVDRHELGNYSMAFALADMADSLGLIIGPILGLGVSQVMGPSSGVLLMGSLCLLVTPFVFAIKPTVDEKEKRR